MAATVVYYRKRITASVMDAVTVGVLPAGAAGFLGWVLVRSVQAAPASQNWSLAGVIMAGVVLTVYARLGLKSRFFAVRREHYATAVRGQA